VSCGHLLARKGFACPKCGVFWPALDTPVEREEAGLTTIVLPPSDPTYSGLTTIAPASAITDGNLDLANIELATIDNQGANPPITQEPPSIPAFSGLANPATMNAGMRAERCRKSLAAYVKEAWDKLPHLAGTKLEWGWHHDALCLHLQTMAEEWAEAKKDPENSLQRIRNLLINIAPGTTKTLITLVFFPTWMWIRFPRWSVRCVSSNPRSIQESSDYARQLVTSDWYRSWFIPQSGSELWAKSYKLIPWEVRDDKNAISDWGNTAGGSRRSTGLKAPITGEHTDFLLCDDPHDAEQVNSLEERTTVISKWDGAVFNRVNDTRIACRVIVMQRLHPEDLAGHIIAGDGSNPATQGWCRLVIASEFEPQFSLVTPIGWKDPRKEPGELLDPVRFPRKVLDAELKRLTPRGYAAQHQQRPDADTSVAFKIAWWSWYVRAGQMPAEGWTRPEGSKTDPAEMVPANRDGTLDVDWVCVSVDPSGGSVEEGASNVGILIVAGRKEKRFVLDDCTPGPRGFLDQVEDIKAAVTKAVRITGKRAVRVLVEKKAYGGAALEVIEKAIKQGDFSMVDGRAVVVHFEPYEVKASMGSKEQRGMALEPDLFSGVIYLPEGAPWLTVLLAEFRRFPAEPNDRVDALAQCIERFRRKITWADAFRKVGR
jgi:phage terminase large subunit-like protein